MRVGLSDCSELLDVLTPACHLLAGPDVPERQRADAGAKVAITSELLGEAPVFLVEDPVVVGAYVPESGLDVVGKGAFELRLMTSLDNGDALAELQVVAVVGTVGFESAEPSVSGGDRASRGGVVGVPLLVAVVLVNLFDEGHAAD